MSNIIEQPIVSDLSAYEWDKACQSEWGCDNSAQFLIWTSHTGVICPWEGYLCKRHLELWQEALKVYTSDPALWSCQCGERELGLMSDHLRVIPL